MVVSSPFDWIARTLCCRFSALNILGLRSGGHCGSQPHRRFLGRLSGTISAICALVGFATCSGRSA
jgi:hypothetical protein